MMLTRLLATLVVLALSLPAFADSTFEPNPHWPVQPGSTSTCLATGASGECKVWAAVQEMVRNGRTFEAGVIVTEFGPDSEPALQRWSSWGHQPNRANASVWGDNAYLEMFLGDGLDTCNTCESSMAQFTVRDTRSALGGQVLGLRNGGDTQSLGFMFPRDSLPKIGISNPGQNGSWKRPATLPECRYATSEDDRMSIVEPGQLLVYEDAVYACTTAGLAQIAGE